MSRLRQMNTEVSPGRQDAETKRNEEQHNFSRATLSRRRSLLRCNRRNQFHQLDQPILAVQLALRQLLPTAVAPACVPMRPDAPLEPMVEFVAERSDVGTLVVVAPTPQDRV